MSKELPQDHNMIGSVDAQLCCVPNILLMSFQKSAGNRKMESTTRPRKTRRVFRAFRSLSVRILDSLCHIPKIFYAQHISTTNRMLGTSHTQPVQNGRAAVA
jgi:hypothetical protein